MKNHIKNTAHRYLTALVVVGIIYYLSSCGALGIPTSDELRALADKMDDAHDFAQKTADTVAALPGWPGMLGSVASTVLAGGATLNKYRNLTRASDPRVSNLVRKPDAV